MRFASILAVLLMPAAVAQKPPARPAAQAQPAGVKLPEGAEKIGEGAWRYKDPAGQTWIYRRTPFGLSRAMETEPEARPAPRGANGPRVLEVREGIVKIERITPFGRSLALRPIKELASDEREALEKFLAQPSGGEKPAGEEQK